MSLKNAHFHQSLTVDGTEAGTPLADQWDSGIRSDIVSMALYNKAYFIIYWGAVTASGVLGITVIPCNNKDAGATTTAIPFRYKQVSAPDTNAAWVASSDFQTTTGASQMYIIEVNADDLPLVSGVKYEYCYVQMDEDTNGAQLGGVIIIMDEPRISEDVTDIVTG